MHEENGLNIPKMRTIDEAVIELKKEDEKTAVTKNFVRSLVVSGKIPSVKAGRKYLINLSVLKEYLFFGETRGHKTQTGVVRSLI